MVRTGICWAVLVLVAAASGARTRLPQTGGAGPPVRAVAAISADPVVRQAMDLARRAEPETIADQIRLCEIPAPPFGERARAEAYADAFRRAGLANVRIDAAGNVLGERGGRSGRPHVVMSAHLDTVFPADVPVRVTRQGTWLHGPGIGDDCRGLAVLLAVARALNAASVQTAGTVTFVGTVGEEGLGDLRGVKALFANTLKDRVDRFVSVDGDGFGVTHVGVGSLRYRVTFRGPGGHSYDDFGRASPIAALGLAVAGISAVQVPASPRTTFSVGRVGGGTSINAIAGEAWMEIDMRSVDAAALARLDADVQAAIGRAVDDENRKRTGHDPVTVAIEPVGNRPPGRTDPADPAMRTAVEVLGALSLPVSLREGSTDANLPMSLGIPAFTVGGGGVGRDAHSPRESFNTADSWRGTQFVLLLTVALAN